MSVTQLAERAGLTPQGTRLALGPLVAEGLIRLLGQGRARLFLLDAQHPFAKPLIALFAAEQSRWEKLIHLLKAMLQKEKSVVAAWYRDGEVRPVVDDGLALPVVLVFADTPQDHSVAAIRKQFAETAGSLRVPCDFTAFSKAQLLNLASDEAWWHSISDAAVPLKGLDPAILRLRSRPPIQGGLFASPS